MKKVVAQRRSQACVTPFVVLYALLLSFAYPTIIRAQSGVAAKQFDQAVAARTAGNYALALDLLSRAVDAGDVNSLVLLGQMHEYGEGVAKDPARGVALYRQAAAKGHVLGLHNAAIMIYNGIGTAVNKAEALRLFRGAAELGNANAMRMMGQMLLYGDGAPSDTAAAVLWFGKAGDAGRFDAMSELAFLLNGGSAKIPRDTVRSLQLYLTAAEAGNDVAAANLGWKYWTGNGVQKDPWQARGWYQLAADLGNAAAAKDLVATAQAPMPRGGQEEYDKAMKALNVQSDKVAAFRLFSEAMAKGHPGAAAFVADDQQWGRGTTMDMVAARRTARTCAAMGASSCQTVLGQYYTNGTGGPKLPSAARAQFERAALANNSLAMFYLAEMYDQGAGIPRNDALATHWYRAAYEKGSTKAEGLLKSRGLLEMDPRAKAYIAYIDEKGPNRSSLASFTYEVSMYCKLGGPRCHQLSVEASRMEATQNAAAQSANLQRIWNAYAAPSGTSDAEWRARSECMRKKTESIQKQTYGQQDWIYTGKC